MSPSQNTLHAHDFGLVKRKLCPKSAVDIFKLFHSGKSKKDISLIYKVTESTVNSVLKGRTWTRFHGKITNEGGLYKVNGKTYNEMNCVEKDYLNQFIKEFKTH